MSARGMPDNALRAIRFPLICKKGVEISTDSVLEFFGQAHFIRSGLSDVRHGVVCDLVPEHVPFRDLTVVLQDQDNSKSVSPEERVSIVRDAPCRRVR